MIDLQALYTLANLEASPYRWYSSSSGRIELVIAAEDAAGASHSGQCDADVMALSEVPYIAVQLAQLEPATVADELKEYGAWDAAELADHAQNLQRLLWIACGDIREGQC